MKNLENTTDNTNSQFSNESRNRIKTSTLLVGGGIAAWAVAAFAVGYTTGSLKAQGHYVDVDAAFRPSLYAGALGALIGAIHETKGRQDKVLGIVGGGIVGGGLGLVSIGFFNLAGYLTGYLMNK